MTIEDIKRLKDSVYEIEGLLELAQIREDRIPELTPLIEARIAGLASSVKKNPVSREVEATEKDVFMGGPVIEENPDVLIDDTVSDHQEESVYPSANSSEKDEEEGDHINDTGKMAHPAGTLTELFEESETTSVTPADSVSPEVSVKAEEPEQVVISPIRQEPLRQPQEPRRKPAFCLNDRFRFRRELFNNSDSEFSVAMNRIASMDSYEEAEEHFIEELGWDPDNQEVADFMEIIKIYFEG